MENKQIDNYGWVSIHRKIISNSIFDNPVGFKIWMWCLLKANRFDNIVIFGRKKIPLKSGQFIFGSTSASEQLKMSKSTIHFWISHLNLERYIERKTTNRYSIITILNYLQYQKVERNIERQTNAARNANETPNETNNKIDIVNKQTISEILSSFSDIGKHYKILPLKNLEYWLSVYSVKEIKTAIEFIPLNDFWFDKMDNIILFRRKNPDGEDVDHIGKLLSTPKPVSRKGESLESYRSRFFKWEKLQVKAQS